MMKYLVATILFLTCLACEGGIPISAVEGPAIPAASEITPVRLQLPEGSLTQGISGPNTSITGSNIPDVSEKLVGLLRINMSKGLTMDTLTGAYDELFEHMNYGDAIIVGTFAAEIVNRNRYNFRGSYTAELNDWTGDHEQYFGGGLAFELTHINFLGDMDALASEATVSGKVEMAGTYRGTVSFKDFYILSGSGFRSYNGNIQVEVNGVKTIYYLAETK